MFTQAKDSVDWKNKIINEFSIDPDVLNNIPFEMQFGLNFFSILHGRLTQLFMNKKYLGTFSKIPRNKEEQEIIVACCSNNANYVFNNILPRELYDMGLIIAIAANCDHLFREFTDRIDLRPFKIELIKYISNCGRMDLLKFILDYQIKPSIYDRVDYKTVGFFGNNFSLMNSIVEEGCHSGNLPFISQVIPYLEKKYNEKIVISTGMLNNAAISGNLDLLKYLLNRKSFFSLHSVKPNFKTLKCAIKSGNLEMVKLLLSFQYRAYSLKNTESWRPISPDVIAAEAGDINILKYLWEDANLELHDRMDIKTPEEVILEHAMKSGNIDIVKFILKRKNYFNKSKVIDLDPAIESGNVDLLKFLIDPANGLNCRKPDELNLIYVIEHGHFDMVKFMLDPANGFKAKYEDWWLDCAVDSQNDELIAFLEGLQDKKNVEEKNSYYNPTRQICHAIDAGNYALTKELIDNTNKFKYKSGIYEFQSSKGGKQLATIKHLAECKARFADGILGINDSQEVNVNSGELEKHFRTSLYYSPFFFASFMKDTLLMKCNWPIEEFNPKQDEKCKFLVNTMYKLVQEASSYNWITTREFKHLKNSAIKIFKSYGKDNFFDKIKYLELIPIYEDLSHEKESTFSFKHVELNQKKEEITPEKSLLSKMKHFFSHSNDNKNTEPTYHNSSELHL